MHIKVFQEFENICSRKKIKGSVLEVGAIASSKSLLNMKSLDDASEKVGINLDGPHTFRDYTIHKGNANSMKIFEDDRFDAVLCNALLEHDKFFWKSISEIHRVIRPGGLVIIGVPGYKYYKAEKIKLKLRKIPLLRKLRAHHYFNMLFTATVTFEIHDYPGDYYRFSPQSLKEVFFEGMDHVEVRSVMLPPRLIGWGIKK